jgi:hypothetical protein
MRVVVTQIESDGTMRRRMVETAGRGDAGLWQELITRALAVPLPYRPAPGGPICHLRVDDRDVMVGDCGSNGVSGPITLSLAAWRERCRDDRDTRRRDEKEGRADR